MSDLVRVCLSIEAPLFEKFEQMAREAGCTNRSEFVRDLIRGRMVEHEWRSNRETLATLTLVYAHEAHQLSRRLTKAQHRHHDLVMAATHVHLDRHLCAEMIMMRGPAREIRHLADELAREKGVLHSALSMSSTGRDLR